MATRTSTLAVFTRSASEDRTAQLPNVLGEAIESSWLMQALCWFLIFFL
jgi:hypothetical protein